MGSGNGKFALVVAAHSLAVSFVVAPLGGATTNTRKEKMNWQVAELMGYAYYAERGYRVLVSLVRGDGYDFVAEKGGSFLRVNVKVAGLKTRTRVNSWSISQASGSVSGTSHQNKARCDVFLVYLPQQSRFVELPGSFFDVGSSKSKLLPQALYLS